MGLGAAVRYLLALGPDWAFERITMLSSKLREMLHTVPGVSVVDKSPRLAGIVAFTVVSSQ